MSGVQYLTIVPSSFCQSVYDLSTEHFTMSGLDCLNEICLDANEIAVGKAHRIDSSTISSLNSSSEVVGEDAFATPLIIGTILLVFLIVAIVFLVLFLKERKKKKRESAAGSIPPSCALPVMTEVTAQVNSLIFLEFGFFQFGSCACEN